MLLACAPTLAAPAQRVMSLNLCADQLLLDLLPPARITSVTYLSRQRNESYLSPAACASASITALRRKWSVRNRTW